MCDYFNFLQDLVLDQTKLLNYSFKKNSELVLKVQDDIWDMQVNAYKDGMKNIMQVQKTNV